MKVFRNLAIIVLMTAILMILSNKAEATTGKINTETVRLRKEPNTKSTILEQLDKNDEVEILEQEEGWYKVTATVNGEKITGYISDTLIDVKKENTTTNNETKVEENKIETENKTEENNNTSNEEPIANISEEIEEDKEYTLEQAISIKALPLMSSIEKANIDSGNIKVVEKINDWCKIEKDSIDGWIRINMLKKSTSGNASIAIETQPEEEKTTQTNNTQEEPEKVETTPTSTSVNKTGYVSSDGLRVRKEANTTSEVIDSLSKNAKVSIIGEIDGWYKIKIGDGIGYVSSKYISDTKVPETTSRSGSTLKEEKPATEVATVEKSENVASTSETTGDAVVAYAKQYIGYKYVSGGASPSTGFDCSGFTTYVYKHFGISLNRTSRDQIKNGVAVEKSNLQPGDLVLFNNDANTRIGHVGIYVGGGNFIHSANPKEGVKITALSSSYYNTRYVGARRVI